MDKQLLKALDNLSVALEKIALLMQEKGEGKEAKSDVGKALQSGDFIEQIKEINVGVKAIRKDTQEILRQQRTIIDMQKKKSSDSKTDAVESDPKKESSIKKGVATILLIAVAVLAIGLAFKLVGKIDFISVIGLALAIVLISVAFEKVAKLGLTNKQAISTSIAMVIMAGAVLLSSFLLSKVKTITITQGITITFIALLFHFVAPTIASLIKTMTTKQKVKTPDGKTVETSGIEWGTLIKSIIMVPMLMVGMSFGIMLSSMILARVTVVSIPQGITAILIAGVFTFASSGIVKIITSLRRGGVSLMDGVKAAIVLPLIMLGMAVGIWLSSMVLNRVQPIGFPQAITSILIAAVFAVAAFGLRKILKSFKGLSVGDAVKAALLLPLVFPALSVAIWLSSKILGMVEPISFKAFLGSIMVAAIFLVLSFAMKPIAKGIAAMKWEDVPKIPVFFLLISLAIAAAAFIFYKSQEYFKIEFMTMLRILVLGAVIGVLGIIFAFASKIVGNISWANVFKLPLFFTLITISITISAAILYENQKYFQMDWPTLLRILILGVVLGIIGIVFGIATKIIGNISWSAVFKLPIFFTLITLSIAISAMILFMSQKFIEGISLETMFKFLLLGTILAVLGIVIGIAIKIMTTLGGVGMYIKGALILVVIVLAIMISSLILSIGKYDKYPSLDWGKGVGLALLCFIPAVILIGLVSMADGGLSTLLGSLMILVVAAAIMLTSHILAAGNYEKPVPIMWTLGAIAALIPFALMTVVLGAIALTGIGAIAFLVGLPMVVQIAKTIVEVADVLSKGKYEGGGRMLIWAIATGLLYAQFVPILLILGAVGMASAVLSFFGPNPWEMARQMIVQVAETIVDVSFVLKKGTYEGGPTLEWASGVAIALGAFSPLYAMLMANGVMKIFGGGGIGPDDYANAIRTVSSGILFAAQQFASPDNPGIWKGAPTKEWAEGVGIAIGAFSPVLKILQEGAVLELFGGKGVSAEAMKSAIMTISEGIVEAAKFFGNPELKVLFTENYPKKEWGEGVGAALSAFAPVFKALSEDTGWTTSGDEVIQGMKSGILQIADAIVKVAAILGGGVLAGGKVFPGKSKPDYTSYPTKEWGEGIKNAVENFKQILDGFKDYEGGIEGFTLKTTLITMTMAAVAQSAIMLAIANKVGGFKLGSIPDKVWMDALTSSAIGFAALANRLNSMLTTEEKKTITESGFFSSETKEITVKKTKDTSMVNRVLNQMVGAAGILYRNRKFFTNKIDPNFMKAISSNLLVFARLTNQLYKIEKESGVGGAIRGLIGDDPISRMAKGMVKVADAYSKLATALARFSGAVNSIDGEKLTVLRRFTGNIAVLASLDSEMFSRMMSVLESKSSMFSKLLDADMKGRPSVGGGTKGGQSGTQGGGNAGAAFKAQTFGPSKEEMLEKKLTEIIKVLRQISYNTSGIDDWLDSQGFSPDNSAKLT